jgi:hypothetical protein
MNARGSLAALRAVVLSAGFAVALCGVSSAGCMGAPEQEEEAQEQAEGEVEVEEPLDLTVDSLDVVHGALRVIATMVDGAADVSVRLGGDCEHREVGGGISTPSTFVWAFGEGDIADALSCGLVVRAHVRDGDGFVSKVATLDVTAATTGVEENPAEDAPALPALQASNAAEDGIHLVFAPLSPSARLTTADSVLDATRSDPSDDDPAADRAGEFTVPCIDFARSVLRGRAIYVDGTPFATSLSVGSMALDGSTIAVEDTGGEVPAGEEVSAPGLTEETIAQD